MALLYKKYNHAQIDQENRVLDFDYLEAYCEDHNIEIIDCIFDYQYECKNLNNILNSLNPNDLVIFESLIQFSLNTNILLYIYRFFKKIGANMIILDVNIDTRTPISRIVLNVMNSLYQFEPQNIKEITA